MRNVIMGLVMLGSVGCGKLDTNHTVRAEGTATIVHKVDIDFSVCDDLPSRDKITCIETMLEILKEAVKLQQEQEVGI